MAVSLDIDATHVHTNSRSIGVRLNERCRQEQLAFLHEKPLWNRETMQAVSRPLIFRAVGHRPTASGAPLVVWAPAVLVGLAMLLPLVYLLVRSMDASGEAWELLFRAHTAQTLGRTALLIVTVTLGSAAIAIPLAWLTVRTDLPMRGMWSVLCVLPLVIPSYVGAFLFISVLGPRGMLQQALGPLGVERLPEVYGLPGASLTLVLLSYPYLLLIMRGAWSNLDPATEDSARSLGHGSWSTMLRVTLPQLRPAIAVGSLLVALYTLSDFGAVSLMGYPTFTWVIFQQYESAFDRSIASVLSLVVVGIAFFILLLEGQTRGRLSYYRTGSGASRRPRVVTLGRWKWPALLLCGAVVALSLGLPTAVLLHWLVRGVLAGEPMLFLLTATWNSVVAAGLGRRFGGRAVGAAGGARRAVSKRPQPSARPRHFRRFRPSRRGRCAGARVLRGQLRPAAVPDDVAARIRVRRSVLPRRARSDARRAAPGQSPDRGGGERTRAGLRSGHAKRYAAFGPIGSADGWCAGLPGVDERAACDPDPGPVGIRDARDLGLVGVLRGVLRAGRGAALTLILISSVPMAYLVTRERRTERWGTVA